MTPAAGTEVRGEFELFLEQNLNKELLRFTAAGSIDDGKSTLIGRLLHDSKTVYKDQLASVKKSRINRSTGPIDFSLLIDGLRAEREQGFEVLHLNDDEASPYALLDAVRKATKQSGRGQLNGSGSHR